MAETNLLLYGRRDGPVPTESLRAGPLRLLFEPNHGTVRCIRWKNVEVLRGIYAAVRDPQWDTVPGEVNETRREIRDDSFHIEFDCRHRRREIDFAWHGTLTGTREGRLTVVFDGEARATFLKNRIGLCVLHPIRECAGARARQTRVDGCRVDGQFPELIEPQIVGQGTFRELRSLAHEVEPGVWAAVTWEGDVFEMEDQRNWTDASFKTYGTPLSLPFPVEITAGTRIRQVVTLELEGQNANPARAMVELNSPATRVLTIEPGSPSGTRMPTLGLGLASHQFPITELHMARLRTLGLAHVRVDVRLSSPDWLARWERAGREAAQIGAALELVLHLPGEGNVDVRAVRSRLEISGARVSRVLALRDREAATSPTTLDLVRRLVEGWSAPVGAGSDANFCEFHREQALGRCAVDRADFVFWSVNPQVHVRDDLSVMENLEAQSATVRTARRYSRGLPMVITPVTLRRRFNAVSSGGASESSSDELPEAVDPRQAGLFGAAWTLGSLAELAAAGVDSVTYYETTGWRGVMELAGGSPFPAQFPSRPDAVFPLYHVFEAMSGYGRADILPVNCSDPRALAAVAAQGGSGQILVMANLRPEGCEVELVGNTNWEFSRVCNVGTPGGERAEAGWRSAEWRGDSRRMQVPPFGLVLLGNGPGGLPAMKRVAG